jgi:mannose-6-phosphate isomerase-like protein (cupin superfamily)
MRTWNIWAEAKQPPLERHDDIRGTIVDIFSKTDIQHIAAIRTNAGSIRGDHYHAKTLQYMLITEGSLEYWHKPLGSDRPAEMVVLSRGDVVETPQNEIHALRMCGENEFLALTIGVRGGADYEKDTVKVTPSIIPEEYRRGLKRLGHQRG